MTKKNEAESAKEVQRAYVGPTFKSVTHCTVFIGELPKELQEAQKKCKFFNNLIVELKDYGKAQDDLQNANSITAISYKKACDFIKGGV